MPHGVDPRLLNPTEIIISQIDKASTSYDPRRRDHGGVIRRESSFTINAQIKWINDEFMSKPSIDQTGVDERQVGYAIILQKDLSALGKTLVRGDKITQIEGLAKQLYITRVDLHSHYNGEFKLVKINFSDRWSNDG